MRTITLVRTYKSDKEMQKGIEALQKQGWTVSNTQRSNTNQGVGKTCCLTFILLPLAFRKKDVFQVTFQKEISDEEYEKQNTSSGIAFSKPIEWNKNKTIMVIVFAVIFLCFILPVLGSLLGN